jgi:hypothetical protein
VVVCSDVCVCVCSTWFNSVEWSREVDSSCEVERSLPSVESADAFICLINLTGTYICICVCMCVCMYNVCMYVVCIYVCMHIRMYVYTYVYIHTYVCIYVYTYVCMYRS